MAATPGARSGASTRRPAASPPPAASATTTTTPGPSPSTAPTSTSAPARSGPTSSRSPPPTRGSAPSIAPPPEVRTGFLTQLKVHAGVLSVLFPDGSRGLYDLAGRSWVDAPQLATTGNLYQATPGASAPDDRSTSSGTGGSGVRRSDRQASADRAGDHPGPDERRGPDRPDGPRRCPGRLGRSPTTATPASSPTGSAPRPRHGSGRAADPASRHHRRLRPTALRVKSIAESAGKVVVEATVVRACPSSTLPRSARRMTPGWCAPSGARRRPSSSERSKAW